MRHPKRQMLLALLLSGITIAPAQSDADDLRAALTERVQPLLQDAGLALPGLQVGIVTPALSQSFAWGSLSQVRQLPPGPDTLYEIASFTKPFVAALVAERFGRTPAGEWDAGRLAAALAQPLQTCAAGETSALCYQGQGVRWLDLLTHAGGLPDLPDNLDPRSWQPTREYSRAQLAAWQGHPSAPPGTRFGYSSLGYALLGRALERDGRPLAAQLRTLTDTLGLVDTRVYLDAGQRARLAPGYRRRMPVPAGVQADGMVASGGLKSSLRDLLLWLQYQLGLRHGPWDAAIAATQQLTDQPAPPLHRIGLAWLYFTPCGCYWHSGTEPGFKSFMAFDRRRQVGVVMLANAHIDGIRIEPVGLSLLDYLAGK